MSMAQHCTHFSTWPIQTYHLSANFVGSTHLQEYLAIGSSAPFYNSLERIALRQEPLKPQRGRGFYILRLSYQE
ncbi:hypothetical protein BFP97_01780 [Roseivirga sp. 4D4]|nr:hypothetical protein BFP97_01780 [Roseivirga sp. 4D4]